MADKLLLENGVDHLLLEDGSSFLLMEAMGQGGAPGPLPSLGLLLASYNVVADQGTYSVSGQAAGLKASHVPLSAAQGTYSQTGQAAGLVATRKITAAQGTYSATGQIAALKATRLFVAAQGSYSITGQAAALTYSPVGQSGAPAPLPFLGLLLAHAAAYTLTAGQGSYSITGQAAALRADRRIAAAQGSLSTSGQVAALKATRLMTAAQGAYSVTGQVAAVRAARQIAAGQGTYSASGQAAAVVAVRRIAADQGSYGATGQAAALVAARRVAAGNGEYSAAGQLAALHAGRKIAPDSGAYIVTGQSAAWVRVFSATASGSIQSGGAAATEFAPAGASPTHDYTGTGGVALSGQALTAFESAAQPPAASGGALQLRQTLHKAEAVPKAYAFEAVGGVKVSGWARTWKVSAPAAKAEEKPVARKPQLAPQAETNEFTSAGGAKVGGEAASSVVRATVRVKPAPTAAPTQREFVGQGAAALSGSGKCAFQQVDSLPIPAPAPTPNAKPAPAKALRAAAHEAKASGSTRLSGSAATGFLNAAIAESKTVKQAVAAVYRGVSFGPRVSLGGSAQTEFDQDLLGLDEDELMLIVDMLMEDG